HLQNLQRSKGVKVLPFPVLPIAVPGTRGAMFNPSQYFPSWFTTSEKLSNPIGFAMKLLAPYRYPFSTSCSAIDVERITTGTKCVRTSERTRRKTSNPLNLGRFRSSRINEGI